jgi:hypothetical protein
MTPSSSGRKSVVKYVSNADKILELEADLQSGRLPWPIVPDIGPTQNLVSALPTPDYVYSKISNSIQLFPVATNAKRVRSRVPLMNPHFPRDDFLGTRQGRMPTGQCV